MEYAIKCIQSTTINFLIEKLGKITNYCDANDMLFHLSGINTFFRSQKEFLACLDILKSDSMICEGIDRREYGDFQTPSILTDFICSYLANEGISPDIIIEPTFGKGSFLISALKYFPKLKKIYGIEIHEPYYWHSKFILLETFIQNSQLNKPGISLYHDDVFKFNFKKIERAIKHSNILVLGNPPWVTNSELSSLNSKNLPQKSNFKSLDGLEAITGKSNFDICEYIILMMFNSFSKYNGYLAMLAKNSVIKNLIYDLPSANYKISDLIALKIDAKRFFNASVEASLFQCRFKTNKSSFICEVYSLLSPTSIEQEFGWVGDKFVSDVTLYKMSRKYDGNSPYVWRQGVKHDCSKIMELQLIDGKYLNGFKKELDLEEELIYGLVKSSDLDSPVIRTPKKYVIITQKRIGEDTSYLVDKFPKVYQYLTENKSFFEQRKSKIYKNKPHFSIFGIGDYSFKPYKVAISGFYKHSTFSLILPKNNKPMMLDDTCYFIGFDNISEALIVWAILNSKYVQQLLASIAFLDSKRPYTKDLLMRINLQNIANDITFDEIITQIKSMDMNIPIITKDNWDTFLAKIEKNNSTEKQLSLFEINLPKNKSGG